MSLTTYLLVPVSHERAFKQRFFSNAHARRYAFLPEHGDSNLLNKTPTSEIWQPIIIQQYSTLPTLLDKSTTIAETLSHKATLQQQQRQNDIAILEQLISSLRQLDMPFGFGVLDLGNKRGWQQRINMTDFPSHYHEATLYWVNP